MVTGPRSPRLQGKLCQYLHGWNHRRESLPQSDSAWTAHYWFILIHIDSMSPACCKEIERAATRCHKAIRGMTRSGILPFPQKAEQLSTSSPTESVVSILLQKSWQWVQLSSTRQNRQNLIQKRSRRAQQKNPCGRSFLIGCRSLKHLQTPGLRVLGGVRWREQCCQHQCCQHQHISIKGNLE